MVAHHVVGVSGPYRENGCKNDGVDRRDVEELEHHPAESDHLSNSADFAGPVGLDGNLSVDTIEDDDSPKDFDVPKDDEDNEPEGQIPILSPFDKAEGDDSSQQKRFVGERVENRSCERLLIVASCYPAIDAIGSSGCDVGNDCKPAKFLAGVSFFEGFAVFDSKPSKYRHENEPKEGDCGGKSHVVEGI